MGSTPRSVAALLLLAAALPGMAGEPAGTAPLRAGLVRLERQLHGRIGVAARQGSRSLTYRGDTRFATCSTFKWVLGAAILEAVDAGRLRLDQPVPLREAALVAHSPVTRARLAEGSLSVADLCEATLTVSDNGAANLLEPLIGGPAGLQAFARRLGDRMFRRDRPEPELNTNLPGDPRDTTSPAAMTGLLVRVMTTGVLAPPSRDRLLGWMKAATTGAARIRAGVPAGWTVADKTGTGLRGAAHDVAVLMPPDGEAVYLTVFVNAPRATPAERDAAIAEATRRVLDALR
ncbi:class A beta-lactamase [Mesoterricola sediminis]|uniref:beta-lactamase n=1 Tax=Mesoterricola sediminis TaxID=2927980 RepID=A0AA48GT65_9BACT|nr:class A beta-lactamase [Mesoterricola sediminis]BDU75205.1 beta-lactamase [Mesoterricola sediminis]